MSEKNIYEFKKCENQIIWEENSTSSFTLLKLLNVMSYSQKNKKKMSFKA